MVVTMSFSAHKISSRHSTTSFFSGRIFCDWVDFCCCLWQTYQRTWLCCSKRGTNCESRSTWDALLWNSWWGCRTRATACPRDCRALSVRFKTPPTAGLIFREQTTIPAYLFIPETQESSFRTEETSAPTIRRSVRVEMKHKFKASKATFPNAGCTQTCEQSSFMWVRTIISSHTGRSKLAAHFSVSHSKRRGTSACNCVGLCHTSSRTLLGHTLGEKPLVPSSSQKRIFHNYNPVRMHTESWQKSSGWPPGLNSSLQFCDFNDGTPKIHLDVAHSYHEELHDHCSLLKYGATRMIWNICV